MAGYLEYTFENWEQAENVDNDITKLIWLYRRYQEGESVENDLLETALDLCYQWCIGLEG